MATLRASDTLIVLREMNETTEAIAAALALVSAADGAGLILGHAETIKVHLRKAHAAATYGRDWLMKTPGLIAEAQVEPVALPTAA